jgi:uncharacterized protein YgiM (DUF1202 family)
MTLKGKYKELLELIFREDVFHLEIDEQEHRLYIKMEVASGAFKDKLWAIYDAIDPDFRSGDLMLDVKVVNSVNPTPLKVIKQNSALNVRKGPAHNQDLLDKIPHDTVVMLLSKYNDLWYLIRSEQGIEGYAAAEYLEAI